MDILKAATDWTRAEMVSSSFFALAGVMFLLASLGFWHVGKTEMARAFVVPCLVAGALLLALGVGIFTQSYGRLTSFPLAHDADAAGFLASELARVEAVTAQYRVAVFLVMPLIIAAGAILILFLSAPVWRASLITVIAMLAVVMIVDATANARLAAYGEKLEAAGS